MNESSYVFLMVVLIWSFGITLNFLNKKFKVIKDYYFLLILNSLIFIMTPVYLSTMG